MAILDRVIAAETIDDICRHEGIAHKSLYNWLNSDADFMQRYARAREMSAFVLESEVLDAVRKAKDLTQIAKANSKLAAIKWIAAKRAPKVFGDKDSVTGFDRIDLSTESGAIEAIRLVALGAASGRLSPDVAKTMMMLFAGVVQAEQHKLEGQVTAALAKLKGLEGNPAIEAKSEEKK